jgi:hypothetical protein
MLWLITVINGYRTSVEPTGLSVVRPLVQGEHLEVSSPRPSLKVPNGHVTVE